MYFHAMHYIFYMHYIHILPRTACCAQRFMLYCHAHLWKHCMHRFAITHNMHVHGINIIHIYDILSFIFIKTMYAFSFYSAQCA